MSNAKLEISEREAYEQVIEYLAVKNDNEMIGIALETAKSNPEFFLRALMKVKSASGIINDAVLLHSDKGMIKLPYTSLSAVVVWIQQNKKVEAIKEFRSTTGADLRYSKDCIDYIADMSDVFNMKLEDIGSKLSKHCMLMYK